MASCTSEESLAPLPHPSHTPHPHQAANLAAVAFFLLAPSDPRAEAATYALCEGPLAAALIAWQCAWLLGSPDHAVRCGPRRGAGASPAHSYRCKGEQY